MKEDVKKITGNLAYIVLFYFCLIYLKGTYISFMVNSCSTIIYNDDFAMSSNAANNMVLLAYAVVSCYLNNKLFRQFNKKSTFLWIGQWLFDLLLIPLSVLTMVLYNNITKTIAALSSLESMLVMWLFLGSKYFLLTWLWSRPKVGDTDK